MACDASCESKNHDSNCESELECSICIEKLSPNQEVCTFPCKHAFHTKCIIEHLQHGVNRMCNSVGRVGTVGRVQSPCQPISCPICRAVIIATPDCETVSSNPNNSHHVIMMPRQSSQSRQSSQPSQPRQPRLTEMTQFTESTHPRNSIPLDEFQHHQLQRQIQCEKIMLMSGMVVLILYVIWSTLPNSQ